MEENQTNEVVEVSEDEISAFDEAWDDDFEVMPDDGAVTDDDGEEPDHEDAQPDDEAEENTQPNETPEEPGAETEERNQLFTIKHLGNEEQLTREEVIELAQKGRDYDHVRQERDSLKSEHARELAFLKDLADRAGLSVDEQIDKTRALWLMNEEFDKGNEISEAEALLRVQREKKNPKQESAEDKKEESAERDYSPQIKRFLSVYPNIPATDIPAEVWDRAQELDGDLLAAYQAYEIKQLKAENANKQRENLNNKNRDRSTGPRGNAGGGRKKDAFDEGWDSDY